MNDSGSDYSRLVSLVELSSSFYEAILVNSCNNNPSLWLSYSKFKAQIYQNIGNISELKQSNPSSTITETNQISLFGSNTNKSENHTNKNSRSDGYGTSQSVNTLLYSNLVVDPMSVEDHSFKTFHINEKNVQSNNITEFIPNINALIQKLDYVTLDMLQNYGLVKDFQGSRLVVPSKSAFYRVISFCYIENLLSNQISRSKVTLKNLFHLVHQGKIALKGPNSVNPSETLRNTFCGYIRELYRQCLTNEKQAMTTFYNMINHDPAFDQSMVSLMKEIIIFSLNNAEFVKENLPKATDYEIRKLIEEVKNSGEITDMLIELVATIFQVNIVIYFVDDRDIKEKTLYCKPDNSGQSFSLRLISQNYKGYLNYFTLYTKISNSKRDSLVRKTEAEPKVASNFLEVPRDEPKEVIATPEEPLAFSKPENLREVDKPRTNPSTPSSKKIRGSTESPHELEKSPSESKLKSAVNPISSYGDSQARTSDHSIPHKSGVTSTRDMDFISPKGKQPTPTRSVEHRPGDFKKLGALDGGQYKAYTDTFKYGDSHVESLKQQVPVEKASSNQLSLDIRDAPDNSPSHKRSNSEAVQQKKTNDENEFLRRNKDLVSELETKIEKITSSFNLNTKKLESYVSAYSQPEEPNEASSKWRNSRPTYGKINTAQALDAEPRFSTPDKTRSETISPMLMDSIPRKQPTYQNYNMEPIENFTNDIGGSYSQSNPEKKNIFDFKEHFRQGLDKKQQPAYIPVPNPSSYTSNSNDRKLTQ